MQSTAGESSTRRGVHPLGHAHDRATARREVTTMPWHPPPRPRGTACPTSTGRSRARGRGRVPSLAFALRCPPRLAAPQSTTPAADLNGPALQHTTRVGPKLPRRASSVCPRSSVAGYSGKPLDAPCRKISLALAVHHAAVRDHPRTQTKKTENEVKRVFALRAMELLRNGWWSEAAKGSWGLGS
jgi:hypothetical protein